MPLSSTIPSVEPHIIRPKSPGNLSPRQLASLPIADVPFVEGSSQLKLHQTCDTFSNAHDFVINHATFTETHVHQVVSEVGKAVFRLLEPYTLLDATKDSSARGQPPECYPETRLTIRKFLENWVDDDDRGWKMLWIRGSAGTGKSAVAQSFANSCDERRLLGASYFFCRTAGRDRFETVVPTLAYQLSIKVPQYRSLVAAELADNPLLLRNSPHLQFKKLIIEPFLILHRKSPRKPVVIVLDGLDECKGEEAQLAILTLISDALHVNPDLPILWLICSRPEQHFKHAFSTIKNCGRQELVIDKESHKDIELYVRTRIVRIQSAFREFTPSDWPSDNQLKELLDKVSGLFVLAATCLDFVGDTTVCDPVGQLNYLLEFLRLMRRVGSRNPLITLDLLYSQILRSIPVNMVSTTLRILSFFIFLPAQMPSLTQVLCNLLLLNRYTFYRAVRGLHSVMLIPDYQNAFESNLGFHHTSFQDFLLDPDRSGDSAVGQLKDRLEFAKSVLYWYDLDTSLFHANDGIDFDENHDHSSLPGLTWVSPDNEKHISFRIAEFADNCWDIIAELPWDNADEDLLSRIYSFDFGCCNARNVYTIANWFFQNDPSNTFVRTEPSGPNDLHLLNHFRLVIQNGVAKPAVFPLKWAPNEVRPEWAREYFIIGRESKSAIVWLTSRPRSTIARFSNSAKYTIHLIGSRKMPSEAQISAYRNSLRNIGWNEDHATLFIKQSNYVEASPMISRILPKELASDSPLESAPIRLKLHDGKHPAATKGSGTPSKPAAATVTAGVENAGTTSTANENTKDSYDLPGGSESISVNSSDHSEKPPTFAPAEDTPIPTAPINPPIKENVEKSQNVEPQPAASSPVRLESSNAATPDEAMCSETEPTVQDVDGTQTIIPNEGKPNHDSPPTAYDSERAKQVKENGNTAFKAGKYEEAVGLYTDSIQLDPTEPLYLTNRAAAYMGLKRFKPALEDCQRAATLQHASPQLKTLLRLARCQFVLGSTVAATSTVKDILSIEPSHSQALELQEKVTMLEVQIEKFKDGRKKKEWSLARLALDECFRATKGEVPIEWRIWEVQLELARGNWTQADMAVNDALRNNTNSPDVLALRGLMLFLSGNVESAKKHVSHALHLDPSCEPAMRLRKRIRDVERLEKEGNAAFQLNQVLDAVEKYTGALERIGEAEEENRGGHVRATLLSSRAAAFFELARYEDALKDATSSLELSPKSIQLSRARARIYLHLQQFDSCVSDFKHAIRQAESEGRALDADVHALRMELKKVVVALNRNKGKNYYDVLGVSEDCNESDIRMAYDREAWNYQLNRGGDGERFQLVVEAYAVLSDPQRRGNYDMGESEDCMNNIYGGGGFGGFGGFTPGRTTGFDGGPGQPQ